MTARAKSPCAVDGCERPFIAKRYCMNHYRRFTKYGDPLAGPPVAIVGDDEKRFWSKVDKRGPDECWPWIGGLTRNRYGSFFTVESRQVRYESHRWMYLQYVGPIPEGLVLDHTCHNGDTSCPNGLGCLHRRCVNPAHLEPVTRLENVYRARGSSAEACPKGHPRVPENRGSKNRCKLCERDYGRRVGVSAARARRVARRSAAASSEPSLGERRTSG